MRQLSEINVPDLYSLPIILLSLMVAVSSVMLKTFPTGVVFAVVFCVIFDFLLQEFRFRKKLEFPSQAIISGLIIGSVAPISASVVLILLASGVAICSKLVRIKHRPILNPATVGLLVALASFGIGDTWWVLSSFNVNGVLFTLGPILFLVSYKAKRIYAPLFFILITAILQVALVGFNQFSWFTLDTIVFGINYYFAFVMMADPKTSPNKTAAQIAFGVGIALTFFLLSRQNLMYALLISLLAWNIVYYLYRASLHHVFQKLFRKTLYS